MRGETITFEITGTGEEHYKFGMKRLEVLDSLKGQKYVASLLGPILDEGINAPEGSIGNIMGRLQESFDTLPDLLKLFAPYCTTQLDPNGPEHVNLGATYKTFFRGDPVLTLAFIAHCIQVEYGDFLSARGRTIMGAAMGNLSLFQTGSTGESGE